MVLRKQTFYFRMWTCQNNHLQGELQERQRPGYYQDKQHYISLILHIYLSSPEA
jgi:hypothetical protein